MPSGTKKMVVNARERAVSTDINRLQDFQQAAIAEVLRHMLLASTAAATAGGVAQVPAATASPMPAIILDGFLARPSLSTDANPADLYVDPGAMFVVDADATPGADDSVGKIVRDPLGMQTTAAIQFQAAVASTRIDVVEIARVDPSDPSTIVETASRDIYNPATGTFSATTVTKATDGKVQYRIRRGVEGSGFPGTASKWLPIMVAVVPVGVTNWDGCVCFDVRPLLADRWNVGNTAPAKNEILDAELVAGFQYEANGGTDTRKYINGRVNARYSGALVGGYLPAGGLDLSTNDYAVASFISGMSDGWWSLYLAFPFGLPRWCRYAAAPNARLPGPMRGIPVASQQACDYSGAPTVAIALPTNLGFAATTTAAVRVFTAPCTAAAKLLPAMVDGDGWYSLPSDASQPVSPSVSAATSLGGSSTAWTFSVQEGTHVPPGTKAVELAGLLSFTEAGALAGYLEAWFELYNESAATALEGNLLSIRAPKAVMNLNGAGGESRRLFLSSVLSLPPSWPGPAGAWSLRNWHFAMIGFGLNGLDTSTGTVRVSRYRI